MFPMTVIKKSARAQSVSGGKEYHLVLVLTSDSGKALYIERFGKAGKFGSLKVQATTQSHAQSLFDKKYREKFEGEYRDHFRDDNLVINDETALKKALGTQYLAQMSPADLKFILPGINTAGARAPEEVEFEQQKDGTFKKKDKKPIPLPEEVLTPEQQIENNPMWGMF
jgi:hypothetical protein